MANSQAMAQARADCEAHGINWRPKSFRRRPKTPRSGLEHVRNVLVGPASRAAWRCATDPCTLLPACSSCLGRIPPHRHAFHLRYARALAGGTHYGGSIAARINRSQGFNPSRKGLPARCCRRGLTDRRGGRLSSRISTLTELKDSALPLFRHVPIFSASSDSIEPPSERVYGCVGTVLSGWFRMDWLAGILSASCAQKDPEARFEVVTRDDAETVRAALDPDGKLGDRLAIFPSASESVHEALQKQSASVMFLTQVARVKLGSAPTRLGEALGAASRWWPMRELGMWRILSAGTMSG